MSSKLYIIGNGFDMHHGIPSSYGSFKDYVEETDRELYEELNKYFNPESLWSDFEQTLQYIDTEEMVDYAMNFLESYSNPDWSDAMHHDYQYELEKKIDLVTEDLKRHFLNWILSLKIENHYQVDLLAFDKKAKFLNFNYTKTLEQLYKIDEKNIFYIHNKALDTNSLLILGHSRNPADVKSFNDTADIENQDTRVTEGNELLDNYFLETYKNSKEIINDNEQYFKNLSNVVEVVVVGHSMSEVDAPYFDKIVSVIDRENVIWKISYYDSKNIKTSKELLLNFGVSEHLILFFPTADIETPPDPNQQRLFE